MKTKLFSLLSIIVLMTSLVSCEDRLDIAKHGNMGTFEDYYETDEEVTAGVASMYVGWRNMYYNWYMAINLLSDDMWTGGGSRNDNTNLEALNEYKFTSNHSTIQSLYTQFYTLIYRANLLIDRVADDSAIKRQAKAEAHVVRAWAHFNLVTLWGTAPIVDHLLSVDEYRQSNGTPEETWAFIESDLNEAINSGALPSKSDINDAVTGMRITLEVAKAMLGKAFLFQEKYSQAAEMLDQVISSGKYALYPDYGYMLHARANNNCESMIELQLRDDTEVAWKQFSNLYCMIGWRTDKLNYSEEAQTYIARGTWGFCNPRKDLYNAFVEMEGIDGYRLNATIHTVEQLAEIGVTLKEGASMVGNEGYFWWKIRPLIEDCVYDWPTWQAIQYIDYRIMRYAEVLLLAAEAHVMSGNQSKALEYINKIRDRAQEEPLASVTLDDVKKEKRLELCFESVRYQDLVRWGDAEAAMGQQGKEIPVTGNIVCTDANGNPMQDADGNYIYEYSTNWPFTNSVYGFKEKHKLLPIPQKELEVNSNMQQNPGW